MNKEKIETATLAGGCFWCTEAVFQRLEGVGEVFSGFTGGTIKNPPYREVVAGRTGHAEAIQFQFDAQKISYKELLLIFFATHDPTTLNRQAYDTGPQYRSAVFYHSEAQKKIAESLIKELNETVFQQAIVTEITPASTFYKAEEVHRDFYNKHTHQPYCQVIINPKLETLRKKFSDKLKTTV